MSALQKKNMKINRREAWTLVVFGLVNTALRYMFAYIGLSYIPSSRSTILDSKEPFMWQYILAGGIVATGIYVINRK